MSHARPERGATHAFPFRSIIQLRFKRSQTTVKQKCRERHEEGDTPTKRGVGKVACVATCTEGVRKKGSCSSVLHSAWHNIDCAACVGILRGSPWNEQCPPPPHHAPTTPLHQHSWRSKLISGSAPRAAAARLWHPSVDSKCSQAGRLLHRHHGAEIAQAREQRTGVLSAQDVEEFPGENQAMAQS